MKRNLLLLFCIIAFCLTGCTAVEEKKIEKKEFMLDTFVTISLFEGGDVAVLEEAFALIDAYEQKLSKKIETSEVARLNQSKSAVVSTDLQLILDKAVFFSAQSGGAFDITIEPVMKLWNFTASDPVLPTAAAIAEALDATGANKLHVEGNKVTLDGDAQIDLGGVAKGYIADRVRDFLVEKGVRSAIINLGGNVVLIGDHAGKKFSVGVADPLQPDEILCIIEASDCSVVTSGIYQRQFVQDGVSYHHVLDPKTGYPANNELSAVTVVSPKSVDGDALSTACLVLGPAGAAALAAQFDDTTVLLVDRAGNILPQSTVRVPAA